MHNVRVDDRDHKSLKELAKQMNRPMSELIADGIEQLRRRFILETTNSEYKRLMESEAGAEFAAEARLWDSAVVADVDDKDWTE